MKKRKVKAKKAKAKPKSPEQGEPEVLSNTDIEVVMEKDSNQGDKITDLLEE